MIAIEKLKKKGAIPHPIQRLCVSEEGEVYIDSHAIYIKLRAESYRRKIADLAKYDGSLVLLMKRNRDKHMQRVNRSYGFNEFTLRFAKKATHIYLIDDRGEYLIPIAEIRERGQYLHFKSSGLEKQLFYSIYAIERHKI